MGASAVSAIPLLLLIPFALGLAADHPQAREIADGIGKRLEDINTGIQKTLGIYNEDLASQFKMNVAPHLQNIVLGGGFIAIVALLAGVAGTQCTPGGVASSDNLSGNK